MHSFLNINYKTLYTFMKLTSFRTRKVSKMQKGRRRIMLFLEIPSMTSKVSKKVSKDGRERLKAIPVGL
jgi:hypothetical protein